MKPLRSIVEVAEPKTTAEKAFKAKHKILKHPDRNGNGDDVFNASKVKKVKKAPRHGYDYPDDVKVYEAEIEEGKVKKKAVNESCKVGDVVLHKGVKHEIIHIHDSKGAKDFMTGKMDPSKAGHYNIRELHSKRSSYPKTVAPSEVKHIKEQLNEGVAMDHYVRHHNTAMEHAKNIVYALKQHKSLIDSCPSCHSGHAQDMKYLADNLASAHLQIGQHVENEQRNAKNRAAEQKRAKLLSKVKYKSTAPYDNYHSETAATPVRESQQLDEISKDALHRYLLGTKDKVGAIKDYSNIRLVRASAARATPNDRNDSTPANRRYKNLEARRESGIKMALKKLAKEEHLEEGGKSQLMIDLEQLPRHIFKQKYGRSKTIAKKQLRGV